MASIADLLSKAESILSSSGVIEPRREALSLLALAIRKDKTFLYAHPEHELDESDVARFESMLERRADREPLQYISGVQEFYGLDFEVTPDVLIPRPETEMVVEKAIEIIGDAPGRFCEIGIGSGCIAVSILRNCPKARAVGLDISDAALRVASRNAERHDLASRLDLIVSDVFDDLADRDEFDLIVSNPPYVPARDIDGLQVEVRDFEPHVALTDGSDGLSIIRRIVTGSTTRLKQGGTLLIEIGFDQSAKVADLFESEEWEPPRFYPDLQGIPRLLAVRRN